MSLGPWSHMLTAQGKKIAVAGCRWINVDCHRKTPSYPQVARFSFVGTHFPNRNGDVVGAVGLPMLQAFGLKLEKK